jgi:hypothetical protein
LSAKRSSIERNGIHAWHPYYAGYSEGFVTSAIHHLSCDRDTLILDPWGGSGTTGAVASRNGVPSICLDLNPVMATFAASKSYEVLLQSEEIEDFFQSLKSDVADESDVQDSEPLENIFHEDTARLIRAVVDRIPPVAHLGDSEYSIEETVVSACRDVHQLINPTYAFYLAVLFVSLRRLSGISTLANPTWLRTGKVKVHVNSETLFSEFRLNATNMLGDLREFFSDNSADVIKNYSLPGDARNTPIRSERVDRIITSPPYLTRIDYAISTMPEMFLFGDNNLVTFVRHQTMGAPVITINGKEQKAEWGEVCNTVLNAVKTHRTKAATSYYWKNIVQYFMDMDAGLSEIVRVLKAGGKGLIVVQSSYFKEVEIPLGDIYQEMATLKGLNSHIAYREEVKGHMAHVNTKSSVYKQNKIYYEDFIYIEKPMSD